MNTHQTETRSTQLTLSAHVGQNARVFEQLMDLHVPHGSIVADVTHGKGCFWNTMPKDRYILKATDIKNGVDCRSLPYSAEEIDIVVTKIISRELDRTRISVITMGIM